LILVAVDLCGGSQMRLLVFFAAGLRGMFLLLLLLVPGSVRPAPRIRFGRHAIFGKIRIWLCFQQ
jgi:hypothetical protein